MIYLNKYSCLQLACKYLDKNNADNITSLKEIISSMTENHVIAECNESLIQLNNFKDWIYNFWNIQSSDDDHSGLKIKKNN